MLFLYCYKSNQLNLNYIDPNMYCESIYFVGQKFHRLKTKDIFVGT